MILQKLRVQTSFVVPKQTGTPGDDLVAWGLAKVVSTIAGRDVVLRDAGAHFAIDSPIPFDDILERTATPELKTLLAIPWLGSTEKGRNPSEGIDAVDRDLLRAEYEQIRAARQSGANSPQDGDAPGVVINNPEAKRYPLYRALTNPGTQWNGFNGFVEVVQRCLLTPAGFQLVLRAFKGKEPFSDAQIDDALKQLGIGKVGDRWRNPPGFLYPGLNKGPTLRLRRESGRTIGQGGHADWMMADRGDRSVVELYLAYVGYFAVSHLLDGKEGRVVLVPAPGEVRVPRALPFLDQAAVNYSTQQDYLLARAALAYGWAALRYWEDFRSDSAAQFGSTNLLVRGVHLSVYWMPSGNTYSLQYQGLAPIPAWLGQLDFDTANDTIRLHERRLANIRGPWQDEKKLSSEQRAALEQYAASLSGEVKTWLTAIRSWFPVMRDAAPKRTVYLWHTDEIGRIVMALASRPELLSVIEHESFQNVTRAIRYATVNAHYARENRQKGGGKEEQGFDPDYDLVTILAEAADRGTTDFLRELFDFVTRYNDVTMRRNRRVPPPQQRRMITTQDLDQIALWVSEDRHGLLPAALLAYGTSLLSHRNGDERASSEIDERAPEESERVAETV